MKKTLITSVILAALVSTSFATVTLSFNSPTSGGINGLSTSNLLDTTGVNGLVWGIVVDANGGGFDTENWTSWTLSTTTTGFAIPGSTGDILYIGSSNNLTQTTIGTQGGIGGVNQIASLNIVGQASVNGSGNTLATVAGDAFAIIWFDAGVAIGESTNGVNFGLFQHSSLKLPGDGFSINYGPGFAGAEAGTPLRPTFSIVPEPSAALLGGLGLLGLLRRRRN